MCLSSRKFFSCCICIAYSLRPCSLTVRLTRSLSRLRSYMRFLPICCEIPLLDEAIFVNGNECGLLVHAAEPRTTRAAETPFPARATETPFVQRKGFRSCSARASGAIVPLSLQPAATRLRRTYPTSGLRPHCSPRSAQRRCPGGWPAAVLSPMAVKARHAWSQQGRVGCALRALSTCDHRGAAAALKWSAAHLKMRHYHYRAHSGCKCPIVPNRPCLLPNLGRLGLSYSGLKFNRDNRESAPCCLTAPQTNAFSSARGILSASAPSR